MDDSINFMKTNEDAINPVKNIETFGIDLFSPDVYNILPNESKLIDTGINFLCPKSYYPRVSYPYYNPHKIIVLWGGILKDNGNIGITLHNLCPDKEIIIKKGDKIAHVIFEYYLNITHLTEITDHSR